MALSADEISSYTKIIDSVLAISDLQTISAKKVRKAIQAAVDHDISEQKDSINKLIEERYEIFQQKEEPKTDTAANGGSPSPEADTAATIAAPKRERTDSELSDVEDSAPKPKKKVKRAASEDDDAAFAARLQAEEDSRARPTRGSATRKARPAKSAGSAKKKKSAAKVKADDDSDVEAGEEGEPKRTGAFHKPFALSEPLAELVGEAQLSRPQVVKKIWAYVKERDLQNPDDKRQIMCDDKLKAVFKQDSVHMFTMNKILSKQLYPIEE